MTLALSLREVRTFASPVARWDARWKLAALFLATILTASLHHWPIVAVAWVLSLALAAIAQIPWRVVLERQGLIGFLLSPVLILLPLTAPSSESHWLLWGVSISQPALSFACAMLFRCTTIATLALVLLRSEPMSRILCAAHHLYIPGVLIQILQLAYRYTFLFVDEVRRLRIALRSRAFRGRTNLHSYRTTGHVIGTLLVRASDRAEHVSEAMRCRGFDGQFRSLTHFQTQLSDVAGMMITVLTFGLLLIWDQLS